MDFRQDSPLSHAVSWCKKVACVKRRERIYPSLIPKTEHLFDLRDSVKEEMIKELMVGTTRTKECREWLIKVREFEIRANELLKFHEKTSDNLRFSLKLPHADLVNTLDGITHLLESCPLVGATKTISCSMIEGKSFGPAPAERTANAYLWRKTGAKAEAYLETETCHAMGKEAENREKILPDKYVENETLMASSSIKPVGGQPFVSVESQVINEAESITTIGTVVDMPSAIAGSWLVIEKASAESLLPSEQIASSSLDPITKHEMVSSSLNDYLTGHESEIELISFEEEIKPSLSPKILRTMLDEIEEIPSSHETESETGSQEASQISELIVNVKQSVEPTIEVGASTSHQSSIAPVEPVAITSLRKDEIPLTDEMKTKDPCQTEDRQGFYETEVAAKTTVGRNVFKILELLKDDRVRKIGVYGIGGVGKTTVLKALINYPKTKDMFDLIIWVTVSKYWSIRKIQDEVLRQLSTQDEVLGELQSPLSKSDSEIREELFHYLEGKKFLLLLDDVWKRMDLEALGIPDPSLGNGCAMIMATRKLKVCDDMHLTNVIEVGNVSKEEAWELFREQVGGIVDAPDIQDFAQGIVERCGGLPLLVIVTGRALSGEEDVVAWEQAFRQFSGPCRDVRDCNDIIRMLKFSFDRLKVHDLQSCFLHCALFSEEQEVNISEFVKYSIQEGLIEGIMADAYKRGHAIVAVLVRASLLESINDHAIKMHDMMRDLALAILSQEEGNRFLLRAYSKPLNLENHSLLGPHESPESNRLFFPGGYQFILRAGSGLTEPPSVEEWDKFKMIFLMDNKLSTLPERPSCPGLLTLFLQRNFRLRVIPMSFFDCMPCLKVLNLSKTRIKCLPKTISNLLSLETLILCHCERLAMLPSEIGSLKLLQILDLRGTEINTLPDEIGGLVSLKYLDVCFYGSINRSEYANLPHGLISSGIISGLHALESLGINVCPGDERWDKCVKSITYEVSKLTKLTSLSFSFPEVELLELFLLSVAWIDQSLTEYKIVVGHDIKRIVSRVPHYVELEYGLMGQCLRFVNGRKIPDAIVKVLARCSAFYLDHHLDISSISKFGIGNINKLKYCIVSECPAVKAIVDNEEFTEVVFPCLEHLNIHYLWNLESIWVGVVPEGSFAMLRTLHVHACPKLKYVLRNSMLQFITNLEELIVDDCAAIEKIIVDDMTVESSHISHFNFKTLTLHYLPVLDNIWEGAWPLFEYINVYNCPNIKKINLDSELKRTLKEIKGEKDWWDALEWKEPALRMHFDDRFTPVSEDDL
ncbi:probable disease resistance protein At1g61300 [Durio zibethinus]|uniref:Probable disease resistance protein At1g61300 n=1 Tax=Durio zibethinus TaxID=66656 RepID=A0A6P5X0W6_DURZI|nr:probable disease resistance protein At1g61300 [Durio zibethinus]